MAGYAGFQRARKGLGSRRGMRRSNSSRGSRYGYKKSGTTFKPRFATVGFTRDVEKKYSDKALIGNDVEGQVTGANTNDVGNGFMYASRAWSIYDFATPGSTMATTNDLVKNLTQGSTASTRIGNKIKCSYIKGAITLTAAKLAGPSTGATNGDMNGEALATADNATTVWQYLRTTFRVCIVKDMQVNSVDAQVNWNDVFETGTGAVGETGACTQN